MDRETAGRDPYGQLTLFDDGAPGESGAPRRLIRLDGRIVEYRFARRRRRTIGIIVDGSGLRVAAPPRASLGVIEAFMQEKQRWILARLAENSRVRRPPPLLGIDGETLPLAGRPMVLELQQGAPRVAPGNGAILVRLPEPQRRDAVRSLLVQWLKSRTLEMLAPRVAHYAALLGRPPPPLTISRARTQWGVCMQSGAIRLSWRLALLAPALADYVVAHEVAHLVELNHSKRFWKLLETLYPEWRAARIDIRHTGALLPQI